MRPEVQLRIRSVYPTGRLWEPVFEQYLGKAYDDRIWDALCEGCEQTIVQVDANWAPEEDQVNQYAFTLAADPCFLEWVHSPRQEKLRIIGERGRNVPVFWLCVSKVFPTYGFFYNIWMPRGDTGYLDIDRETAELPFKSDWIVFQDALFASLKRAELEQLPENESRELVPFVSDLEFDDDDNVDDEGYLVPVDVYQCLFGRP